MFIPASRQTSTRRVASATSLAPRALKNSLPPPNVPVPRLSTGTLKPEPPSCLYCMTCRLLSHRVQFDASGLPPVRLRCPPRPPEPACSLGLLCCSFSLRSASWPLSPFSFSGWSFFSSLMAYLLWATSLRCRRQTPRRAAGSHVVPAERHPRAEPLARRGDGHVRQVVVAQVQSYVVREIRRPQKGRDALVA